MPESVAHVQRTERFDLNALYETSRLLSTSLDLEFVLNNLLLTAMSKLLVTRGAVLLYDPLENAYRTASSKGLSGLKEGDWLRFDQPIGDRMLMGDEVPQNLVEKRIALVIPVRSGHREIGLIALGEKATRMPFERREMEFVVSLVNMTSAAVHNSLMVEELKQANRDLDAKIQQLNTLFDLSQEFNATIDRTRLVKLLSFALMGQMLVGKYLFLLRSSDGQENHQAGGDPALRVVASKGIASPVLEPELARALCARREIVLLQDDEETDPQWQGLRDRGIALAIPLQQHGETCGALCLGPKMTGQPYQPDDVEFLYALGNQALVSIQNTYLIEEQIEKERLEEEIRLARDIQLRLLPRMRIMHTSADHAGQIYMPGVTTMLMVGVLVICIAMLFTTVRIPHPWVTLSTVLLGATIFSLAGFVNAVFAKKFDDVAIVPSFILTPLTYLGGVFYSVRLLPDWDIPALPVWAVTPHRQTQPAKVRQAIERLGDYLARLPGAVAGTA